MGADYAYLRADWIGRLTADPGALHCTGYEAAQMTAPFEWKRVRPAANAPWPPKGAGVVFHYGKPGGLQVDIHYEMYEGIPALAKWFVVRNGGARTVRLNKFASEILAIVEQDSAVDAATPPPSQLHVESDYSFRGMDAQTGNRTTVFLPDPQYETQVNYQRNSPLLIESRPPIGPNVQIAPGGKLESFRTYELAFDSTDRERRGLALRRLYRTISPWATENPILMHVRQSDPATVRSAIDQCAETGFEMVILSFGSRFDAENEDPGYRAGLRELVEYGKAKGVELGGYSLLASRKISLEDDVINPETGKTGGAIFGNSPCLMSKWADGYFRKIYSLFESTGLSVLEHDGSYPGDVCASQSHPGHEGLEDSQWRQWERIRDLYRWCRARGIYLNVPDWYFLNGSTKVAMGYRETNWSLPRERQFILGRQNIYDGTWYKTPSMGWMFVPLTQYHGGGAEATLEPLKDHLDAYEQHLVQNFSSGVQACYRGPRLFDSPETKAVVKRWVDFYKAHRTILDSDVIHLRRPDGRDWDGLLHVNPESSERALAFLFNPLPEAIRRTIRLPLYYTGLTATAKLSVNGAAARPVKLGRDYSIEVTVQIPAKGWTWLLVE
ncbi:MAG: alpha-galactosidase [Acidobacteria bacterium]|nr:alpha-galactosidase [Acidobacteriota bacterium]